MELLYLLVIIIPLCIAGVHTVRSINCKRKLEEAKRNETINRWLEEAMSSPEMEEFMKADLTQLSMEELYSLRTKMSSIMHGAVDAYTGEVKVKYDDLCNMIDSYLDYIDIVGGRLYV